MKNPKKDLTKSLLCDRIVIARKQFNTQKGLLCLMTISLYHKIPILSSLFSAWQKFFC